MRTRSANLVSAAAALLIAQVASIGVAAEDTVADTLGDVAGEAVGNAIADSRLDGDCIAGAVADAAVAEGVRKGRKLLGRLGIGGPARSAAAPCGEGATASAAAARPAPASTPATDTAPIAPEPAAEAPRRGLLGGLRQARQPASRGASGQRNCGALGAGCANGLQPVVDCIAQKTFWSEMADAVEHKRNAATGLSAQDLADMDADIAAMRAAHAVNAGRVEPVDPAKPNRHTDWLTPEEYSVAASAASQAINAHRQMCNQKHTGF